VQGYVYAAKRHTARVTRRLGREALAFKLDAEATRLAERFETAFWCSEIETYALALDGAKNPCRVRTSNAGQVLFSGIAGSDRAACVAAGLMQPRFFSGWGIRTLARGEARYNPMSYHNGSIWPHDNALIALGLARYGRKRSIETLFEGLFSAATYMDLGRLPELFCGFKRQRGYGSTLYPVACLPQAWASATPFTLLAASLGLEFDPLNGEIRLRSPRLPAFLDEVILRNLQLGQSTVDVRVWRRNDDRWRCSRFDCLTADRGPWQPKTLFRHERPMSVQSPFSRFLPDFDLDPSAPVFRCKKKVRPATDVG
jgi:glycogen debranching enzyme